jgi:membrane-associated phospholipid phosphatase
MQTTEHHSFYKFFFSLYITLLMVLMVTSLTIPKGEDILWINGHHTRFLDYFFHFVTNLGDGLIFAPIILGTLFVRYYATIIASVVAIANGIAISILKRMIFPIEGRPVTFMDHSLLYFVPGVEVHSRFSFPSGHTATAFAAAVFISLMSKSKSTTIFVTLIALLVGYSRVYLLQHFLIDACYGALVGSTITAISYFMLDRQKILVWMNRRLEIKLKSSGRKSVEPS